jgi:hypothetical protein
MDGSENCSSFPKKILENAKTIISQIMASMPDSQSPQFITWSRKQDDAAKRLVIHMMLQI